MRCGLLNNWYGDLRRRLVSRHREVDIHQIIGSLFLISLDERIDGIDKIGAVGG